METLNKMLVGTALAFTIFAVVLGIVCAGPNVLAWDAGLTHRVQQWQGQFPTWLQHLGDGTGGTRGGVLWAIIGLAAMRYLRWRVEMRFILLAVVFRLLGVGLKPLFDSPRPAADEAILLNVYQTTGYPSGHSMTAAVLGVGVILITWHRTGNPALRWCLTLSSVGMMMLVGWSRIWAGAHWASDVLGGWCFGIAIAVTAWAIATHQGESRQRQPRRSIPPASQ